MNVRQELRERLERRGGDWRAEVFENMIPNTTTRKIEEVVKEKVSKERCNNE